MAASNDKRRKARAEYVFNRMSAPQVALTIGVSAQTIQRWKMKAKSAGDDWDLARQAHIIAGEGLESIFGQVIEDFALLAQSTISKLKNDEEMTAENKTKNLVMLADAMTKAAAATKSLAPRISQLGVAQDVISRLFEFIKDEFPQHADALQEVIEPFGDHIAQAYG